jgi:hypothetical protein
MLRMTSVAQHQTVALCLSVAIFLLPVAGAAQDGHWWSGFYKGPSDHVHAMVVYDGRLIVGGVFKNIGDLDIPYLAAWDGNKWSSLGEGPGGEIVALTVYKGDLYAAGYVNDPAPGGFMKYVMRWNGSEWSRVGGPFDASIWSLTVHGDDLIAGGYFRVAEGDSCRGVARWNGSEWSPLGAGFVQENGLSSFVLALAERDGVLSMPEAAFSSRARRK